MANQAQSEVASFAIAVRRAASAPAVSPLAKSEVPSMVRSRLGVGAI